MPETLRNGDTVNAVEIENRCHCMPEGVGVDVRKVVAFGKFGQPIRHAVRVHGFAVFLSENKIPVVPTITHSETLFKL